LPVAGLDDRDARRLLLDNVYGPIDPAVCDQIIAESHGNPLALLELRAPANGGLAAATGCSMPAGLPGASRRAS
jgi:hypothetical protein